MSPISGSCALLSRLVLQRKTAKASYHIHQGHVEEHACRDGEDPEGNVVGVLADRGADEHPNVSHHGGEQVVHDRLLYSHACFQENRKIPCNSDITGELKTTGRESTPSEWKKLLIKKKIKNAL